MKGMRTMAAAIAVGAMLLGGSVHASSWSRARVPAVPQDLEVPPGQELFLVGHAEGTQNYVCLPAGAGFRWTFLGPQATVFHTLWGRLSYQVTTHFLSANPLEAGAARATWQHSFDSSRVWARARASSADPVYVKHGAIPWLLLESAGAARGPLGGGALAGTTFIQRLNTAGGAAPSTGCGDPGQVGAVALVPYTAEYYFYRAADQG